MLSPKCETFALHVAYAQVAELFSMWGAQVHIKKVIIFNKTSFYTKFDKP